MVVVNGFSKAWAMTGWRLGWMVVPRAMLRSFAMMSQCYNTGSATFSQAGAVAALEPAGPAKRWSTSCVSCTAAAAIWSTAMLGEHPKVELLRPDGAFYAFPKIRDIDGLTFATELVRREKVGVAPGYTFGPGNENRVRIAFACSHDRLEEALTRIRRYLDQA